MIKQLDGFYYSRNQSSEDFQTNLQLFGHIIIPIQLLLTSANNDIGVHLLCSVGGFTDFSL